MRKTVVLEEFKIFIKLESAATETLVVVVLIRGICNCILYRLQRLILINFVVFNFQFYFITDLQIVNCQICNCVVISIKQTTNI